MKIGIGCIANPKNIVDSILESTISKDIVCYTTAEIATTISSPSINLHISNNPVIAMINDLKSHAIDAAIRGTLPANATLSYVKKAYNINHLRRIAFLETAQGQKFLLAPVGVDEGWTIEDKIAFVTDGKRYARAFGLSEKTVVLAGGRTGDIGRHSSVDRSILEAKEVCKKTGAEFGEILIEDAIKSGAGIIIAPDGISGNLIFRTLALLGNGFGHGAPIINLPDIFVDSSRASSSYATILSSTAHLVSLHQ